MGNTIYDLTNPQKSILLTEQFYQNTNINHICGTVFLERKINFDLLKKAIHLVVKKHDSFRLQLVVIDNELKQLVSDYSPFDVEIIDVNSKDDVSKIENDLMAHIFDIYHADFFCFKIFRFQNGTGGFILNIHHLLSDSWGCGLIAKEIVEIYSALLKNESVNLTDDFSYVDYIDSEKEYLTSDKWKKDKEYWNTIFETIPEQASIPSMETVSSNPFSCTAKRYMASIDKTTMKKVTAFCKLHRISVFNFFMAVYSIYIGRVSNLDDFVVGTPILNRTNFKEKNTTGMFINTSPLRISIPEHTNFDSFVSGIAKNSLSMLRHQKYSYQLILEDLRSKQPSLPSLYQIIISYQVTKTNEAQSIPYQMRWSFTGNIADDIDIHLFDLNDSGTLNVAYDYKVDKYSESDITCMHARILYMMEQILEKDEILLEEIKIVTPKEEKQLLYDFNDTKRDYPRNTTVVPLFEEQVRKYPNDIAVIFGNERLTYQELDEKTNALAHCLKEKYHVQKDDVVGIFLDKSLEVIIAILGILKAEACYLPIDVDYPSSRISYMLEDSKTRLVLTSEELFRSFDFVCEKMDISLHNELYQRFSNVSLPVSTTATDLAYIMYTSGSTGKPKGVMVEHRGIVRLVKNTNYVSFDKGDRIIQAGSIVFDACTFEIWGALLNGLELYIIKKEELLDTTLLKSFLADNHITTAFITSALFNQICEKDPKIFAPLKYLITGGDVLSNKHMNLLKIANPNLMAIQAYGPTENTTFSTCYTVPRLFDTHIPIGHAIANSTCYVVSKDGLLQPIGVPGELWVGGDGVSRGYLNRPELTNEKFLTTVFDNERIYKTGDLVKWLPDGTIEFIGRIDGQVKIRGFRVELSEINSKILEFPSVKDSYTIISTNDNNKAICSYVSFAKEPDVDGLKSFLKQSLPSYMVPTYFMVLEKLPININGKVDKQKLPLPTYLHTKEVVTPRNKMDQALISILQDLLKLDSISMDDSFLELGGDSLSAIRLCSIIDRKFHVSLHVADVLTNPVIEDLSDLIQEKEKSCGTTTFTKALYATSYPLSSAQKRIFYTCKMIGNDSLVYNVPGAILVDKILDANKLLEAFRKLIARHSSFRTSFVIEENEVRQKIESFVDFNLPVLESSSSNMNTIMHNFVKPFSLEKAPLIRAELYYLDNRKTLLLVDSHHIIMDGSSLDIFLSELASYYDGKELNPLELEYKDFAVWENEFLHSDEIQEAENYWVNKFKYSDFPSMNLPYDYNLPSVKTYHGSHLTDTLGSEIFEKCEQIAKQYGVSSYVFFISAFFVLLYQYTGQEELIIGSPCVGRQDYELKNMIGMFVNNIVMDAKIRPNQSFTDFLVWMNSQILTDLKYQTYPFDLLVKKLNLPNDPSRNPLFDVVFTYQNMYQKEYRIDDMPFELMYCKNDTAKFNITVEVIPQTHKFSIEYNSDLFKENTIKNFLTHYLFVLEQIANHPQMLIEEIPMITPEEDNMLTCFNATDGEINDDTMVSIFEKQVKRTPDNIALICEDVTLTYQQLNQKANSLAHHLIQKGIGNNDIVCIMTNRSLETVVCMLGILKAGAAFFNVDPTYPTTRTQYYLEDSKTKYVLTQRELKDKVKSIENCIEIDLDCADIYGHHFDNPKVVVQKEDLSYIIYTSGSTGTPKGVMLNQVGLANMVKAMTKVLDYLKEGNRHTIVSVTSSPFDIFVYEIVVSLAHGLKVVMANNAEHRNPKLLDALIRKHNVDVMTVTPSLMKINYDNREPDSSLALVKNMVFGGEPLPEKFVQDLRDLANDITIYNIYGPSEITVLSNVQNLDNETEITVGPPIMNTQIHILDKNMKRVPIGVVGEIYISGIQVGLGYIGKPEMTSERFMDNPFGEGKIYKSGDIGRWTFDGKVQCLGRVDHQIKLRGLRIELGEIENVMVNITGVTSSIVNKIDIDGKEVLCGYYVSDSSVTESTVRDTLRNALPYYMVPTYIVRLDEMPYTINRKIDRKALPLPELNKTIPSPKVNIKELDSNEEKLLQIWKMVLSVDHIDIDDNFFDIGGDSISAINMQIEAIKYGLQFEYADIFNFPTIRQLSKKSPSLEDHFIENYDYSKVKEVLSRNTLENLDKTTDFCVGNVLLIGSTGYLGAHLVHEFLEKNTGDIYCLIRPKNHMIPVHRLASTLSFYFGAEYWQQVSGRIRVIEGDIITENLGLSKEDYDFLKDNVNVVINSGAIVKHFGQKQLFEDINVTGTKNIIEFCKKEGKRLLHVSTISVSGNGEKEETVIETSENKDSKLLFTESDLYVGQHIKGVYTTTKFRAELLVLEAISNGLDAQILRIGNITNRYLDGVFQLNAEDNAFAKRLKSFIEIGAVPKYVLGHEIELTPVDLCAEAIIKILQHHNPCNMFHIYNPNLLSISLLLDTLESLGIEILPVSDKMMADLITGILEDDARKDIISGIIHDLDSEKRLVYTSNIRLDNTFTVSYLKQLSFSWKELGADYITKYINYFKKIGFID